MPKPSRTKEIIKMRVKINEIENRKTTRKKEALKPKLGFLCFFFLILIFT